MRTALVGLLLAPLALLGLAGSADANGSEVSQSTRMVVVRPVTADGQAAPGWKVHREREGAATCSDAAVSAVDDGIVSCYPSALYLPSCWPSTHHTVLCLRDATSKELVRVRYRGSLPAATAPDQPSPQALTLTGGQRCALRVGGAWGSIPHHRTWLGFYSCAHGSLYGPPNGDGIRRAVAAWRVHLVRADNSVSSHSVRTAYFVGTAV
jgi:hypothetical protein